MAFLNSCSLALLWNRFNGGFFGPDLIFGWHGAVLLLGFCLVYLATGRCSRPVVSVVESGSNLT